MSASLLLQAPIGYNKQTDRVVMPSRLASHEIESLSEACSYMPCRKKTKTPRHTVCVISFNSLSSTVNIFDESSFFTCLPPPLLSSASSIAAHLLNGAHDTAAANTTRTGKTPCALGSLVRRSEA